MNEIICLACKYKGKGLRKRHTCGIKRKDEVWRTQSAMEALGTTVKISDSTSGEINPQKVFTEIVTWLYQNDGKFASKNEWRSNFIIMLLETLNLKDEK